MDANKDLCELIPVVREANHFVLRSLSFSCQKTKSLAMSMYSLTDKQADEYARLTPQQIDAIVGESNVPIFLPVPLPSGMVAKGEDYSSLGALTILLRNKVAQVS